MSTSGAQQPSSTSPAATGKDSQPAPPAPARTSDILYQQSGVFLDHNVAAAGNTSGDTASAPSGQPYYDSAAGVWKNSWTMAYPYSAQSAPSGSNPYAQQFAFTQFQPSTFQSHYKLPINPGQPSTSRSVDAKNAVKAKPPSPSPPPPDPCRDWDVLFRAFMKKLGLSQALKGFELDMLVMNSEWEENHIASALDELVKGVQVLRDKLSEQEQEKVIHERPLEERKLDYVHLVNDAEPSSPTSINKSISQFLSRKRLHNDVSNRNEFLLSIAQKRAKLSEETQTEVSEVPSCARTDAKQVDRDAQMKYDIARNEDGPLKRTMKARAAPIEEHAQPTSSTVKGKGKAQTRKSSVTSNPEAVTLLEAISADRHPGLDERLANIETHLSVRYVPSPPLDLLDRLKFLEDHIIQLEKDYPSWPPPPPSTPIIVPPHLTRDTSKKATDEKSIGQAGSTSAAQPKGRKDSSLHRAVLERLEVKNAKSVLANRG
ncbi:hypothetical protein AAF712_000086 [Marasmius tenuissimus]|uniref:Uncharacterized protein n=1 Tax=Marasmius tenuissimus TaxID=585030 RepID=A0ABR3AFH3_9AGAR